MPVSYVCIIPQIDSRDWSTVTTEVTIMRWECTEATRYSFRLAVHMTKKEQCLFSACVYIVLTSSMNPWNLE